VFSFLRKNSHQKISSFIATVKKQKQKITASKYIDELIFTVRRSGLEGVISFKWIYHGESIGLVVKQ